jgi:TPR repeat protein
MKKRMLLFLQGAAIGLNFFSCPGELHASSTPREATTRVDSDLVNLFCRAFLCTMSKDTTRYEQALSLFNEIVARDRPDAQEYANLAKLFCSLKTANAEAFLTTLKNINIAYHDALADAILLALGGGADLAACLTTGEQAVWKLACTNACKAVIGDDAYDIGCAFYYGNDPNFPQSYEHAAIFFQDAVEQGNTDAMYKLGIMYRDGKLGPSDTRAAVHYFESGTTGGNLEATHALGRILVTGEGGFPKDMARGASLLRTAADNGNAHSAFFLAQCSAFGTGVRRDYEQAYIYFKKAADAGLPEAKEYVMLAAIFCCLYLSGSCPVDSETRCRIGLITNNFTDGTPQAIFAEFTDLFSIVDPAYGEAFTQFVPQKIPTDGFQNACSEAFHKMWLFAAQRAAAVTPGIQIIQAS